MNLLNKNIYKGICTNNNIHLDNIPGWSSYHHVFDYVIQKAHPHIIIEVGTWLGASAINMIKICKQNGIDPTVYCVDTWLGSREFWTVLSHTSERDLKLKNGYPSVYFDFLTNVVSCGMKKNIIPVPNTSNIAAKILKHYRVAANLIYIDGSHEREDVRADINNYLSLLAPGGIIFGDDYDYVGVRLGVSDILSDNIEVYDKRFWIHYNKI